MLKMLGIAASAAMLIGSAPAPVLASSIQTTHVVTCDDYMTCVLVCWKMSGDWGACEIACMDTICPVAAPKGPKGGEVAIRSKYSN